MRLQGIHPTERAHNREEKQESKRRQRSPSSSIPRWSRFSGTPLPSRLRRNRCDLRRETDCVINDGMPQTR
jgi:hypothetical protein